MGKKAVDIADYGNAMTGSDEGRNELNNGSNNGFKTTDKDEGRSHLPDKNDDLKYERNYEPGRGFHRYDNSLKNLIPIRRKGKEKKTMAIDSAGLFAFINFTWMSNIMYKAYRKGITMEELPALSPYDAGDYNAKRLELLWEEELAKAGPENVSFIRVAWRFSRTRILASILVYTCSLIFGFLGYTFLMRKLLEYVESGDGSFAEGVKWAALLTAAEMFRILFMAWSWALNYRTGLKLSSACITLLFRKIIRMDNLGNRNIGKVINIISNDAQRIFFVCVIGTMIIGAPISTVFGVFYVLWLLGPMALIGMIAFLLFFPIQYVTYRLMGYLENKKLQVSDKRIRLMNEILDCIKLIKMYAWEKRFSQDLLGIRKLEQQLLLKASYCLSLSISVAPTIPVISAIITFLAYTSAGYNLTAAQVFPYTSFLDSGLCWSLYLFQDSIEVMVSASISMNRIRSLLLLEERRSSVPKPILKSQAVAITQGTFACNTFGGDDEKRDEKHDNKGEESEEQKLNTPTNIEEPVQILFDISFEASKGKLVGICGQVGSGKSSLLLAALGQLEVSKGQVTRDGSCAYVSQQAWITNTTLRENILFGEKYDHSRYNKTIYACSLSQDIGMMPAGDQTEIGEKGVNLSGGQKQRVALARALYADRDIYFLDDPLSAVDSRVGYHIFNNLILGALKGKTVLFVTHQIQYLNQCDDIYMMRDGRIVEHGTHDELMKLGDEYASMVAALSVDSEAQNESIPIQEIETTPELFENIPLLKTNRSRTVSVSSYISAENVEKSNTPNAQLTIAETLQHGTVKGDTYRSYILAAGGYVTVSMVLLIFLATDGSIAFSSWWLALWINAGSGNTTISHNNTTIPSGNILDNPDYSYYKTIYGSTIGAILLTSVLRSLVFTKNTVRASTKLHNNLFKKVIDSPMRFFDTTPSGRIQHLFSRDMDSVGHKLPIVLENIIQYGTTVFFAVLVICVVFPWFILPLCILGALYYLISKIFRVGIRDLKRMENKSRAPIISFVTATVQGLSTIHAFDKQNDFMTKFTKLFDENSKCLFLYNVAMRWLAVRIDALSVAIVGITALMVVVLQSQVPAALAGLALAYSAHISDVFQYVTRLISETEIEFISVERINHYIRTLQSESSGKNPTVKPPSSWPAAAEIKFQNVSMAYGEGAPLILKNLTFSIDAGEKIGIVGRTGAGKSSLTIALFRLVELTEGKIEIDGVDISEISLEQLRTKLSIIPQDPVLFSGTIRSNLDPFKLYSDAEIWEALEKTELKEKVQSITGQLDASVEFGGDNLSVGERQLLCLSRALLRNSKILVLDEATAAVDPETEVAVQNTVQREFANCTILTIAHRLQTVLPLDRVLVMEGGKVLEFDTPSNLLQDSSSEFSQMIAAAEQAESQQSDKPL